jgi:2-aminoadipate transaminase
MNPTIVQHESTRLGPRLSSRASGIALTPLQKALAAVAQPGILSLAMGLPDTSLFPASALARAADSALGRNPSVLQYTLPCPALKEKICRVMLDIGVDCTPDCIFLTNGAQQAINLLTSLFLDPGGSILEEELSYPGFQHLVDLYHPRVFRVPTSRENGIDVAAVARLLESGIRPAFMYLMPNAHNPLGVDLPLSKRCILAGLAREFQVPLIEDDPYGALVYEGVRLAPIRALEPDWSYYVGSFSKILGPSLRVGWIVAPIKHVEILSVIKEGFDLNVTTFSQYVINELLCTEELSVHIRGLCDIYRQRRAAMNRALQIHFPEQARWRIPSSGFFFWIDLPNSIDSAELLSACLRDEHVAFLPAQAFSRNEISNGMRLNFTSHNEEQIEKGIAGIGRVLCKMLA